MKLTFTNSVLTFEQIITKNVSIWIPLLLCCLFVLVLLKPSSLSLKDFWFVDEPVKPPIEERIVLPMERKPSNYSKRIIKETIDEIDTTFQIEKIDSTSLRAQLDKENVFSEAYKYLCTCSGANKILARKPMEFANKIKLR